MKLLRYGTGMVLIAAGLAAVPGGPSTAAGTAAAARPGVEQRMSDEARGTVRVSRESATGKIGFIRATGAHGDLLPSVSGDSLKSAVDKAGAYVSTYASAFGARAAELRQTRIETSPQGWTVTYTQSYRGVPVFGSMLKANVDRAGELTSVNGFVAPDLDLSVTPSLSEQTAADRAIAFVRTDPPGEGVDLSRLEAESNTLMIYRLGAIRGEAGRNVLIRAVEVTNGGSVREMVMLDAISGKPVNRYSLVADFETDRVLKEAFVDDHGTPDDESDDTVELETVWADGDPFPGGLNADQQNLMVSTGNAYWLFANTFGRDSYDGNGATMTVINNDPRIDCPNASWDGTTTNYCDGVTSDDIVAHEWGHAYTEKTSGLIYQWQSGALNESYSDVWGETIDLVNGRDDAGEGDSSRKRTDGRCHETVKGDIAVVINSPAAVAGPCADAVPAATGPNFPKNGLTTDMVIGVDANEGTDDGFTTTDGCSPFDNADDIEGNFVYVDRGGCFFTDKGDNAAAAGAAGIIIGQNKDEPAFDVFLNQNDLYGAMVGFADAQRIHQADGPLNITVTDVEEDARDASYRWLMGEQSEAFGGAIRDMWNPTCYGNAGKVSDAQYVCDLDNDGGGVHQNSGIPNHAYALLVDGGTYNGVTVPGIGLDKAANVYWATQTNYLTPTSDFTDFANGLDAACTSLVGVEIHGLQTKPETPGAVITPITPADCAAVASASRAVELRMDPSEQCDFRPLLKGGSPNPCGKGTESRSVWKENFSDGLGDWTKGKKVRNAEGLHFPWHIEDGVRGRAGAVAFVANPTLSQCGNPDEDQTSTNWMTSPPVQLPDGGLVVGSRLVFDHYVATEAGWDGGNLKISVNGGTFKLVPAKAFRFNGYNAKIFPRRIGNTDPLASQPAFTGSDGGTNHGSWGESQVNLGKAGARPGDKVKIRFEFGRDVCGGMEGWAVDNVQFLVCKDTSGRKQETATRR